MLRKSLVSSVLLPALLTLGFTSATPSVATQSEDGGTSPIQMDLSFPNRVHHEMQVRITFPELAENVLEIRMSRSSPGRYALHEFAKNVYGVGIQGAGGKQVSVSRPNPHQWNVEGHGGSVTLTYTLFGDRTDGTYAAIDRTHAHLNAPAAFAWARGLEERSWEIRIEPPEGWTDVATQLPRKNDSNGKFVLHAPNLQYLLDSPMEIGDFKMYWWDIDDEGRPRGPVKTGRPVQSPDHQQVRISLHHAGTPEEASGYVEKTQKIVEELVGVFGEAPRFDYGSYVFLADYIPWANGDGMEHRNSTVLSSSSNLASNTTGLLGTVAHEFVHAWSIERLRPASLEPFDFERANMSGELWFGEGFTSYYDDVILARSGIINAEAIARRFGGMINFIVNSPARQFRNPIEMSRRAPFVDAASWLDPTNDSNTFISYYSYGAFLGLALDLEIRQRFTGKSLDNFMQTAWRDRGATERPYTNEDLRELLGKAVGDKEWANESFRRYIYSSEVPDLTEALEQVGFVLRLKAADEATWGQARLDFTSAGIEVTAPTPIGSPLYEAGVTRRDVITRVRGKRAPRDRKALDELLAQKSPGDRLQIEVESRGTTSERSIQLVSNPEFEVVTFEDADRELSATTMQRRRAWLGVGAQSSP